MSLKRALIAVAVVALAALLVVGLVGLSGSSGGGGGPVRVNVAQMRSRLDGSPPALAALHTQAGEILDGGLPALRSRLAALRGEPVVINKWASWCEPCRAEFGIFQRVSIERGRAVAFIGIDSGDTRSAAAAFLGSYPLSYPSYFDQSGAAGLALTDSSFTPVTVFYDRSGRLFIHQGPYPNAQKLERDIERYALNA